MKNIAKLYHSSAIYKKIPKTKIGNVERVYNYQILMGQNNWTQAELSRHLRVSRAWVTKVIKRGSE